MFGGREEELGVDAKGRKYRVYVEYICVRVGGGILWGVYEKIETNTVLL